MTGRRTHSEETQWFRRDNSSSDSSASSDSEIESSSDSDISSDGLDLGLGGKSETQQKFRRLRRIFLNRPPKLKTKASNKRRQHSSRGSAKLRVEQNSSTASVAERQHSADYSISSAACNAPTGRTQEKLSRQLPSARPLQAAIDQHMNSLWEQMKRHSVQRDSSTSHYTCTVRAYYSF
ncbi:unnamed protein product [Phytophthora fragariaefolia]|uniref:Unnamed protein product n=1 Tax=Phytophthora fragariaefolia TaxID=1490495 RepID=A0A9W6WXP3_9STRA|nr:unnamed protein product [Phytophthora fragariaefolia]